MGKRKTPGLAVAVFFEEGAAKAQVSGLYWHIQLSRKLLKDEGKAE